jgi:hypothetical protein
VGRKNAKKPKGNQQPIIGWRCLLGVRAAPLGTPKCEETYKKGKDYDAQAGGICRVQAGGVSLALGPAEENRRKNYDSEAQAAGRDFVCRLAVSPRSLG